MLSTGKVLYRLAMLPNVKRTVSFFLGWSAQVTIGGERERNMELDLDLDLEFGLEGIIVLYSKSFEEQKGRHLGMCLLDLDYTLMLCSYYC